MLETMKRKTYRNFLVVRNKLLKEKGYGVPDANDITHRIFENYRLDPSRTIRDYYDRVLCKEEFEAQQERR